MTVAFFPRAARKAKGRWVFSRRHTAPHGLKRLKSRRTHYALVKRQLRIAVRHTRRHTRKFLVSHGVKQGEE